VGVQIVRVDFEHLFVLCNSVVQTLLLEQSRTKVAAGLSRNANVTT
jgi:hypothetical protein